MTGFLVVQEKFEGPLGLLLELIEKEKLEISEISLSRVTDEFLAYVRSLPAADPEEIAEFLVVAGQLILVKSRSLLPDAALTEEEEASAGELAARLTALRRMREAANELRAMERRGWKIAGREPYLGIRPVFFPDTATTPEALAEAFVRILARMPKSEKLAEEKLKRIMSLEEKITHIRGILAGAMERSFSQMLGNTKEKIEIVVSFLALLELARQKFVFLHQERPFEDIRIKKIV